jgi:rubrerythrin
VRLVDGTLNLPKTKAEIVNEAERNKDNEPEITPEIIDILRNLPDKRFNDQADLAHAIQTATSNIYNTHIHMLTYKSMSEPTPPSTSPNNPTGPSGGTYVCEICNTLYYSREDLDKHVRYSHPDREVEKL